ncbi:MAG TPA: hypothetical protein VMT20_06860 [Terriglobia bacterium]|nr:hypothetical protein [Terriglobia bacterium]
MSRKRLIAAYVLLVGAPLLGLLGILRSGQRLAAPASVGGTWNLEGDLAPLAGSRCAAAFANISQPFFAISQSGSRLTFTLNNPEQTTLPGTMRQNAVTMGSESSREEASGDCAHPQAIRFQAALSRQGPQRSLTGTLTVAGCPDCPALPFRAVRQHPPVKDGQ